MFGEPQTQFFLNAGTNVAFHRHVATYRNAVAWFDEYKNDIDPKRIQSLKAFYDGAGHSKGEYTNDNRKKEVPVNSACLIGGQDLPTNDNALFKRIILLKFNKTEFSESEKDNLDKLRGMERKGLSHITTQLLKQRKNVEKSFQEVFDFTRREFDNQLKNEDVETRISRNFLIPIAMYRLLDIEFKFPLPYQELEKVALDMIVSQSSMISNNKETQVFWDIVESLLDDRKLIEGEDFKIQSVPEITVKDGKGEKTIHFKEATELLYIRMNRVHKFYLEAHRKQYNKTGMDKGIMEHYLRESKENTGTKKSMRFSNNSTSAHIFNYSNLGVNLERVSPPVEQLQNS